MPITPERWGQVQGLFLEVVELDAAARATRLGEVGAGDPDLRAEVESLLRADVEAESQPALVAPHAALLEGGDEGTKLGPFQTVRLLGSGGMGDVYLAHRADGSFEQEVALKVMRPGFDLRRFEHERQVLARLVHPGIARLYDGGITRDGRPWFAMEPVSGLPLDEHCSTRRLSLRARLRLFGQVCAAVHYAHAQLVVHRDLKPSNILVTDDSRIKLVDFGIAKLLGPGDDAAPLTRSGTLAMTPEYAAPEQVRGEAVTTATDVYALGVVLFELLTGRRPYEVERASPADLVRIVCDTPATPPSRIARGIPRDLDAICSKALRKEPERRYPSPEQLREDLERWLADRPVRARRGTLAYRASRFVKRHVAGLAIAGLLAGLTAAYAVRLARERDRVMVAKQRADQISRFLERVFVAANPEDTRGNEVTARQLVDEARRRIETERLPPDLAADLLHVLGNVYAGLGLHDDAGELLTRSLALAPASAMFDEAERATLLRDLGDVRREQGRFDEAEAAIAESLRLRRAGAGDEAALAESLDAMGALDSDRGQADRAEAAYRAALAIRQRLQLPEAGETLTNLGLLAREQGRYAAAAERYREAIALDRAQIGDDAPATIAAIFGLADALRKQGKLDEAEPLYRETLEARRRLYRGGDHPDVANSLNHLGRLLYTRGRYDEAEPLFREGLAMNRRLRGDRHDAVAASLGALAGLYLRRGDPAAAEPLYREVRDILRSIHGDDHPYIAAVTNSLAGVAAARGDLPLAIERYRAALALSRRLLPPDHPDLARTLVGLGTALIHSGDLAAAEPLLREAHALLAAALRAGQAELGEVKLRWGQCLAGLGRRDQAEALLRDAHAILAAAPDAQARDQARESLASLADLAGAARPEKR